MSLDLADPFNPQIPEPKTVKGFIYLSDEERARYDAEDVNVSNEYYDLTDAIVEKEILTKLFRKTEGGSSNDFLMDHPAARKLRETNKENKPATPDPSPTPPVAHPKVTEDVILASVYEQISTATSPEERLSIDIEDFSLEKRANNKSISESINNSIFQKGPADVPAYHEFHSLKMAFENVWQEAIDLGLIDKAEKWYDLSLANGAQPKVERFLGNLTFSVLPIPNTPIAPPEPGVILEFPEAIGIWDRMTNAERLTLNQLSKIILSKYDKSGLPNAIFSKFLRDAEASDALIPFISHEHLTSNGGFDTISTFLLKGRSLVDAAKERILEAEDLQDEYDSLRQAERLRDEITAHLATNYSFKYFAANQTQRSVNFGILLSYQQTWNPLNYQAGELVKSIPLAPKETRKFSRKTVVKKHRTQKEQEENLRITKSETSDTSRAETEIVNKARSKISNEISNESKFDAKIGPIGTSNTLNFKSNTEAEKDSQQTKKSFHEAVLKASQEFKNERKSEITTEETYESEVTESGEISNPNDELSVTYLFYELQRQFKVTEKLHRLRPVIMVAQEMPAPHEIDMEWVITHDWILKRVLLDDSFRLGMDFIYSINGEKLLIKELERSVKDQRQIVKDLRQNVRFFNEEVGKQNRLLQLAISREINATAGHHLFGNVPLLGSAMDAAEGRLKKIGGFFGMGGDDAQSDEKEAARIRREGATAAFERADRERKELMGRLEAEISVLNTLSKDLAEKRKVIVQKDTHIAQLLAHIKDYILHYMQSIWNYENQDQRYFRLMDTKIPIFDGDYRIKIKKMPESRNLNDFAIKGKTRHEYELAVTMKIKESTLKEVANLDNCLGYKGNYMIFAMNQSNILTDFMMAPYIDSEFGLTDPDNLGNWTLQEYEDYVANLRKEMGENFNTIEEKLKEIYGNLLQDPLRNGDIVTVPTNSLFITSLLDEYSIVEKFKAIHRMEDVKKVQAEVRGVELENLRMAKRILKDQLEDPKIDKKIVIEGNVGTNIET
jgi:hypothetical protein